MTHHRANTSAGIDACSAGGGSAGADRVVSARFRQRSRAPAAASGVRHRFGAGGAAPIPLPSLDLAAPAPKTDVEVCTLLLDSNVRLAFGPLTRLLGTGLGHRVAGDVVVIERAEPGVVLAARDRVALDGRGRWQVPVPVRVLLDWERGGRVAALIDRSVDAAPHEPPPDTHQPRPHRPERSHRPDRPRRRPRHARTHYASHCPDRPRTGRRR